MRTTTAAVLAAFLLVPGIAVAQNGQSVREFVQEPDPGRARGADRPGNAISGAAQEGNFEQLNEPTGFCAVPTDLTTCDCPEGQSPIANLPAPGSGDEVYYECGLG